MNEIALHRGSSPHLNTIDIFVDGQHLTEAVVREHAFIRTQRVNSTQPALPAVPIFSLMDSSYQPQPAQRHTPYQPEARSSTRP